MALVVARGRMPQGHPVSDTHFSACGRTRFSHEKMEVSIVLSFFLCNADFRLVYHQ